MDLKVNDGGDPFVAESAHYVLAIVSWMPCRGCVFLRLAWLGLAWLAEEDEEELKKAGNV